MLRFAAGDSEAKVCIYLNPALYVVYHSQTVEGFKCIKWANMVYSNGF